MTRPRIASAVLAIVLVALSGCAIRSLTITRFVPPEDRRMLGMESLALGEFAGDPAVLRLKDERALAG